MDNSIKLTPLLLFLMILFVLVISILLSNWLPLNLIEEGMISFYQSKSELDNSLILPQYSRTAGLTKIYDNIYFDQNNGNLILIYGQEYSSTEDTSGSTISSITIIPRIDYNTYKPTDTFQSIDYSTTKDSNGNIKPTTDSVATIAKLAESYNCITYPYNASTTQIEENIQIFYIPWATNTYIHLYNIASQTLLPNSYYLKENTVKYTAYLTIPSPSITAYKADTYLANTTASKDTTRIDPYYDSAQNLNIISDYVMFDSKNGNLIIQTGTGASRSLTIYGNISTASGTGNSAVKYPLTHTSFLTTTRAWAPYIILDSEGQNLVVYEQNLNKTLIALFMIDPDNSKLYMLRNVVRFNFDGSIDGLANATTTATIPTLPSATTAPASATTVTTPYASDLTKHDRDKAPSLDSIISDYYKKYWYSSSNAANINQYSDDFMLKTQMIPPICPACPACPTNTTCTNCGGSGGEGTWSMHDDHWSKEDWTNVNWTTEWKKTNCTGGGYDASHKWIDLSCNYNQPYNIIYNQWYENQKKNQKAVQSQEPKYDSLGNAIGGIAGGIGDVAEGAGQLAGGALLGAGALAGGALSGAGNFAGGVVGGIGNAIGGLGRGGTNVQNYGQQDQGQQGQGYGQQQGQDLTRVGYYNGVNGQPQNVSTGNAYGSYIDQYSYNGALSSKGGDPMPITSDFSKFGR